MRVYLLYIFAAVNQQDKSRHTSFEGQYLIYIYRKENLKSKLLI